MGFLSLFFFFILGVDWWKNHHQYIKWEKKVIKLQWSLVSLKKKDIRCLKPGTSLTFWFEGKPVRYRIQILDPSQCCWGNKPNSVEWQDYSIFLPKNIWQNCQMSSVFNFLIIWSRKERRCPYVSYSTYANIHSILRIFCRFRMHLEMKDMFFLQVRDNFTPSDNAWNNG